MIAAALRDAESAVHVIEHVLKGHAIEAQNLQSTHVELSAKVN